MAKKVKRKGSGRKKSVVPLLVSPDPVDLRTGQPTEALGRLATATLACEEKVNEWKSSYRKHIANGGKASDAPVFDPKHFVNPNKTVLSQKVYDDKVDRHNEGEDIAFLPRFNPVMAKLCRLMNAVTLRRGILKRHSKPPADYNEKRWGSWYLLDENGEHTIPSGWFFDKKRPRPCVKSRVEEMVIDPEKNILTFGNHRYIVGNSSKSAAMVGLGNRSGQFSCWG